MNQTSNKESRSRWSDPDQMELLRTLTGMDKNTFAAALGIERSQYSKWVNGRWDTIPHLEYCLNNADKIFRELKRVVADCAEAWAEDSSGSDSIIMASGEFGQVHYVMPRQVNALAFLVNEIAKEKPDPG